MTGHVAARHDRPALTRVHVGERSPLAAWIGEGGHQLPADLLAAWDAAEEASGRAGQAIADYLANQPLRTD